jgi:hypothetical protein
MAENNARTSIRKAHSVRREIMAFTEFARLRRGAFSCTILETFPLFLRLYL